MQFLKIARRQAVQIRLHAERSVQWTVNVDAAGHVMSIIPHGKGTEGQKPYVCLAPREAKSRSGYLPLPLLITDNAQYVLGLTIDNRTDATACMAASARNLAYLALLETASDVHPDVPPILTAARTFNADHFPGEVLSGDLITFRVEGRNPHEIPALQAFWIGAQTHDPTTVADLGIDALTGEYGPLTRYGPLLKNVPGGEGTLIYQSQSVKSFVSYGIQNLGVSQRTIEDVSRGIEILASDPRTSFTAPKRAAVGSRAKSTAWPFKMLHWLDRPEAGADPWLDLEAPSAEYFASALTGEVSSRESDAEVTVNLALVRGHYKRLAVLNHQQTNLKNARANVDAFRTIVGKTPMWQLERALAGPSGNPDQRHVQALLAAPMLGTPLPARLAWPVMYRWKYAHTLDRGEAAILRLSLHLADPREHVMQEFTALPSTLKNAYALGQYTAQVHLMHKEANPGVSQTLADRYLRMLSVRPARTYGQMSLKVAVLILALSRKSQQRADSMMTELTAASSLLTLPLETTFTLDQRGAFALGYDQTLYAKRSTFNQRSRPVSPLFPSPSGA